MATDKITLTVPARGEYAKTVRMTAAALVGRSTMSYDDVEDVRMAAEEAFVYAVEALPEGADVTIEFMVDGDSIEIVVPLGTDLGALAEEADQAASYATFILESVCDEYEFTSDEGGARLRLLKRAGSGESD